MNIGMPVGRRAAGRKGWIGLCLIALAALLLAPFAAVPASAAPDSLQIDKSVDNATPQPGQTFTYTIQVRCSEDDCLGTTIVDELPDELVGFGIQNVTYSPNALPRTATWQPGGTATPPATVTADTALTVLLQQPTDNPVGTGLNAGTTYTVSISLRVPDDYPPGTSPDIVNTASVSATNANTKTSSATVNVDAPVSIDVAVDKAWTPASQAFDPGASSTIGLDARNTSNVAVDRVVLQEPKAAPEGATTLDASNPFTITDFAGFGTVDLPAGCDTVQVDAYVRSGGTWGWVTGTPGPAPVLPGGVSDADVGGLRITCVGAIEPGATLSVDLDLEQRATHRNDGSDLSTAQHTVANVTTGSATLAGQPTANDDGNASYTVVPAIPTVEAAKNIAPGSITAGQSAAATITATNGDVPVVEIHLADLGFFTDEITFTGFSPAPVWPAGAENAVVTYHLLAGGTEDVPFADGAVPALPSGAISGFEITWTGTRIQANETGQARFGIATTEDATAGAPEVTLTNTVDVDVEASNGLTDADDAEDTLRIVDPRIETSLNKVIRPSGAVMPGQSVIASLAARAQALGDGAVVHDIVVEDVWAGNADGFWNAFDLASIAPTQVPAGTTLTVQVRDGSGTWHTLATHGPDAAATVFQMSSAQVGTALSGLVLDRDDVEGIRFAYANPTGFPSDTTVTPNIEFAARGDLRDGGPVTPGPYQPTPYVNTATVEADGESAGGNTLNDADQGVGTGTVETDDGTGVGLDIAKTWVEAAVDAQSSQRATTHLDWAVQQGLAQVVVQDSAGDPATTPVGVTVYDAFDLVRIEQVAASNVPYSNGWYLKYDTVTAVALYDGTSWVTVPAPGGSWMTAGRAFKGYELTPAQRASTVSVRITVEETSADVAARTAARQPGAAFDPFAPLPEAGVGYGSSDRRFSLLWQVRDTARSDGRFVVEEAMFNTLDEGLVANTVRLTGTPTGGGPDVTDTAADSIQILDPDPAVAVTKSATPTTEIFTPPVGTDPASYPTARWTITGNNASTARAGYVRLTDPATCTDTTLGGCATTADAAGATGDPFDTSVNLLNDPSLATPFDRFDITDVTVAASIPGEVDLAASTVWLLRYDGDVYTTEQTTAAALNALGAAALSDVVGISVTFQGTNPAAGGTITQANRLSVTIDSVLRPTLRSTGANQVLPAGSTVDVTNRSFAQAYDLVTSPGTQTGDIDDATVVLTGGLVNITPTKSVNPTRINQPAPNVPVTVTLGANQGSSPRSTLSPQRVVIEDHADSPEFWNTFRFTGLGTVTLPAGANRVQVDVHDGTGWVTGTPAAAAALPPGIDLADVQGIRFTYSRADGGLFSSALPAANWAASAQFTVQLRDTYRDSGDPVTFDQVVPNTQTSQSTRPDGNDSEAKDASAQVELSLGTHDLAVRKLTNEGNRLATVGDAVPFDLTLRNTGTGFLTLTELRDVLPAQLVYTGTPEATFSTSAGGTLSEDVTITPDASGSVLTFSWPDGGDRMVPGETFTIRLYLDLQPGLGTGQTATNTITARTEETLDTCRNVVAGGPLTTDWSTDPTTCGTTDYVGTVTGPNLFTLKGVRGSLPGAYVPGSPAAVCSPTLTATAGDGAASDGRFYRPQCVANSQVGGVDDWVLHSANAGTVNIEQMTVFDQLPVAGDRQLVSGGTRGSAYRPRIVAGSLKVTAPAGTTQVVEVTTGANVCVGTWTNLATQPVCEQSGEVWTVADGSTDWDTVTGIRVLLDFRTTAAGSLRAGEIADVNFSTENVLADDTDTSGVSRTVPAADQFAWNQHGIKFRYAGATAWRQIAPSRVGVHLRHGSIRVDKVVTGPAAAYAPTTFRADVVCRIGDEELTMTDAVLELTAAGDYRARVDGIPISVEGTTCTVTEQGSAGAFGETTRSGSPTTLAVDVPVDPANPGAAVPAAQVATITNDYQFTGLSVTKRVDTQTVDVDLGPFTFTLSCLSALGAPVVLGPGGATELEFELEADGTWTAPSDRIPVRAACTLTETDEFFADSIVVVGDNVVDNGDGSATITPGVDPAEVEVTNGYEAGVVTLLKEVDGDGAARYGTGQFTFTVDCTFQGQQPFSGEVQPRAGDSRTFGPYPRGTLCEVEETGTGGATSSALSPADGVVEVVQADTPGEISLVELVATNTFDLTSLEVLKVVTGDTTAPGAGGPFEVELACTWLVEGQRVALEVPGGATRRLAERNGYRASYGDLPSSARCTLEEIEDGGAESTSIKAEIAGVTLKEKGVSIALDLSTTGGPGEAAATVTNRFASVASGSEGAGGGGLPDAGADVPRWLAPLGLLLLLAGGGVLVAERRKLRPAHRM